MHRLYMYNEESKSTLSSIDLHISSVVMIRDNCCTSLIAGLYTVCQKKTTHKTFCRHLNKFSSIIKRLLFLESWFISSISVKKLRRLLNSFGRYQRSRSNIIFSVSTRFRASSFYEFSNFFSLLNKILIHYFATLVQRMTYGNAS